MPIKTVTYIKKSLCKCGYSVLNDEIKLGQKYKVDTSRRGKGAFICGQCNKEVEITLIQATRDNSAWGWIPAEIFGNVSIFLPDLKKENA